jgi:hypothetical protein
VSRDPKNDKALTTALNLVNNVETRPSTIR